jgi:hypothetical protein
MAVPKTAALPLGDTPLMNERLQQSHNPKDLLIYLQSKNKFEK